MQASSLRVRLFLVVSAITFLTTSLFAEPTITVLSPGSTSSSGSPVFYEAYATSSSCSNGIAAIRIYTAPGINAYTVGGAHLETFIDPKPGTYDTVVQAWDNCGGVGKAFVTINVNSDTAVTVFMPSSPAGQIPNHLAASAQRPSCAAGINAMRIYTANGVAPYTVHSSYLNAFVNLLPGTYNFTVQAWDNCGKVLKSTFTQTLAGQTDGYLYAVNGGVNGTVAEFQLDDGVLSNPNGDGLPPQFQTASGPQSIAIDPGGWFAYVLTMGGISAYEVSQTNGALMPISGSPFRTNGSSSDITIDPNGNFLSICDKNLNSISVYRIDRSSGALTETATIYGSAGFNGLAAVSTDSSGQYLYAVNQNYSSVQVFGYRINLDTGALTEVPGSPYTVGNAVTPNPDSGFALSSVANYLYVGTQTGTGQAFGYSVNFSTGELTPIPTSTAWLIDEVPAYPRALLADNQGRFVWAPGSAPSTSPQNWFTGYEIMSGGVLANQTRNLNGSFFTQSIVEDGSGKYLYVQGFDQDCTSDSCPSLVSSFFLNYSSLVRISGPLSTSGEGTAARGIAVGRKTGD